MHGARSPAMNNSDLIITVTLATTTGVGRAPFGGRYAVDYSGTNGAADKTRGEGKNPFPSRSPTSPTAGTHGWRPLAEEPPPS